MGHADRLALLQLGFRGVVQYRRKRGADGWHNMAAFDQFSVAENYAKDCASGEPPWQYQAVNLETA